MTKFKHMAIGAFALMSGAPATAAQAQNYDPIPALAALRF
jgi:hypothetical protein